MLPRRIGLSPTGKAGLAQDQISAGNLQQAGLPPWSPGLGSQRENYIYEYERHDERMVKLCRGFEEGLGRMKGIRFVRIFGQPSRMTAFGFEMRVLRVCERMREMAREEGKSCVWGKYGSMAREDRWWWFEGWIEGEEEW